MGWFQYLCMSYTEYVAYSFRMSSDELPEAVAIAWGLQEAPQRGPSRGTDHRAIVRAAVEVADAEGLGAVTMKRVASALGRTTMSLYRYVSGKDVLLWLMQDAALTPEELPELDPDWTVALRQWARTLRESHRRHPWSLDIPRSQTGVLMPNSSALADRALGAMAELDIPDHDKTGVLLAMSSFAASIATLERDLLDEGGVDLGPDARTRLAAVITPDRLPHIGALMQAGDWVGTPAAAGELGLDEEFEFGLTLWIDGLRAQEARTSKG